MTLEDVMTELRSYGSAQTEKIYSNHGAKGEMFGVKIGDLKKIQKKIKGDQSLALSLWETNVSDAMYLAALVADGSQMTKKQLDHWAKTAWWYLLSEYAVPFVASEHPDAFAIAEKWIESKKENIASSGWATLASAISIRNDDEIDLDRVKKLLNKVENEIDSAPNRVRYTMNGFVISVGTYIKPLLSSAKATAKKIGKVEVHMGATSCKVPLATEYIEKVEKAGRVGKKRKTAKC